MARLKVEEGYADALSLAELKRIVAASRKSESSKRTIDEIFAEAETIAMRRSATS